MRLDSIWMRDPFLVSVSDIKDQMLGTVGLANARRRFWLYGTTDEPPQGVGPYSEYPATGFNCYCSDDLVEWEGPFKAFQPSRSFYERFNCQYWACEVWLMNGKLYMFATMKKSGKGSERGVVILESKSGNPEGPFEPITERVITPIDWPCLDGTLHVENGKPYMVFCREWTQVGDGQMCCMELSPDLRDARGEPKMLFKASQAPWSKSFNSASSTHAANFITDGPFLYRSPSSGELVMLWSSIGLNEQYCVGIARSTSGSVLGPWVHDATPLFYNDGGHAMLSRVSLGGKPSQLATSTHSLLVLTLHRPNRHVRKSRPCLMGVIEQREERTGLTHFDLFDFTTTTSS